MCGSLLSKFKETTDKVDHAKTVSPDPLKLIDKFSLKDDGRLSRKDGDRNGEPSAQSLAKIPRKTLGVNMLYSLTQEGFEVPGKGVARDSACYQHIGFQKRGESRSVPSMSLCPRNKSAGAALFSSLSDVECLKRALNGAKSSTGSERSDPKVGDQNTGHPMERQKQEVEGGAFDLQDLETYEASDSDDHSWGD